MMNRRGFAKLLGFGAGTALIPVKELLPVAKAEAVEVRSDKQYVLTFPNDPHIPVDKCMEIEAYLKAKGLNVIVLSGDLKLFEVKLKDE